jgi:hypothetical protein
MSDQIQFVDAKAWKEAMAKGEVKGLGVRKGCVAEVEKQDGGDEDRTLTFTISTSAVDRDNDTIDVDG